MRYGGADVRHIRHAKAYFCRLSRNVAVRPTPKVTPRRRDYPERRGAPRHPPPGARFEGAPKCADNRAAVARGERVKAIQANRRGRAAAKRMRVWACEGCALVAFSLVDRGSGPTCIRCGRPLVEVRPGRPE